MVALFRLRTPMKPLKYASLLACALVLSLSACGGGDVEDVLNISAPQARFVHASSSAPRLTLFRNNDAHNGSTGLSYASASPYHDAGSGSSDWSVRPSEGTATDLDKVNVDIKRGERYTLVALPTLATGGVSLVSVRDPHVVLPAPTPGLSKVRVVNGLPGGKRFDTYFTTSGTDLGDVSPNLRDTAYRESSPRSGDESMTLASRNYRLRLTEAGTRNVMFDADIDLPDRSDRLLVVVPVPGGGSGVRVVVARINSRNDSDPAVELTSR